MNVEDIKTLDVKDKLLIIKAEDIGPGFNETFRKSLMDKGCLGIIKIDPEYDIKSLGLKQLEDIVKQIKERKKHEENEKKS